LPALILFAHGARDPEWSRPIEQLRDMVAARLNGKSVVHLAYLERMSPTLPECIDQAIAEGAHSIAVLPLFLARGSHVKTDLPQIIEAARRKHARISFAELRSIGENPGLLQSISLSIASEFLSNLPMNTNES